MECIQLQIALVGVGALPKTGCLGEHFPFKKVTDWVGMCADARGGCSFLPRFRPSCILSFSKA